MNMILYESTEDSVFLVTNEIIARILFWILSHQVVDEFIFINFLIALEESVRWLTDIKMNDCHDKWDENDENWSYYEKFIKAT